MIPETYTIIDANAFVGLDIRSVVLPDSLIRIGNGAFWGCSRLKWIRFGENLRIIGARSFSSTGLKSLFLPDSVTNIGRDAFKNNSIRTASINLNAGIRIRSQADVAFDGSTSIHLRSEFNINLMGSEFRSATLIGDRHSKLFGNSQDNVLFGNNSDNTIMGMGGDDTMVGRQGDDNYVVNSVSDICIERPNGGYDTILSSSSYELPANVERLELIGGREITEQVILLQ